MKLIWYLLCYSLLGFVGEVLYARLTHSAKPDRKCRLFLPLCPVYGIGAVVIALLPFRSPISVFPDRSSGGHGGGISVQRFL